MNNEVSDLEKSQNIKIRIVFYIILTFMLFIIYKIVHLQYVEIDELSKISEINNFRTLTFTAKTGDIYDIDNNLIVSSIKKYDIYMDPCDIEKYNNCSLDQKVFRDSLHFLSLKLEKFLNLKTAKEIKEDILSERKKGNRFVEIAKNLKVSQKDEIMKFPIFNLGKYKGGIILKSEDERIYVYDLLASRTLGYYKHRNLKIGIEGKYGSVLQGKDGFIKSKRIAGNFFKPSSFMDELNFVENGADIFTNINIFYQEIVEEALKNQLKKFNAEYGCFIIMEVKTGKIKAIANLFQKDGEFFEDYNYATQDLAEPGSTFKLASIIAALEEGKISINDEIIVNKGEINYFGHIMRDETYQPNKSITVKKAFEISSNVGISQAIYKAFKGNEDKLVDRLYEMHLNEISNIDLEGETKPTINNPKGKYWSKISLPWMSIGYEILMTPIQILNFYNAVANNCEIVQPYLVNKIVKKEKVTQFKPKIVDKICSENVAKMAKLLLESVVENGTAKNIKSNFFKIAGKTGTAQIANDNLGYHDKLGNTKYRASFVGYFPADNPKYSGIVVISKPLIGELYASKVAAPIFKEVAELIYFYEKELQTPLNETSNFNMIYTKNGESKEINKVFDFLNIKNIPSEKHSKWVEINSLKTTYLIKNFMNDEKILYIPNLKGLTIKDALYITKKIGLQTYFDGIGVVSSQSLEPGIRIEKDMVLTLKLK